MGRTRKPSEPPRFSFRTPFTLVGVSLSVVCAGFAIFLSIGQRSLAIYTVDALMFATVASLWMIYYRFAVPTRIETRGSTIVIDLRIRGRKEIAPSSYSIRLIQAGWFGGSLSYKSRIRPSRPHGVMLTYDQAQYLAEVCPELLAAR